VGVEDELEQELVHKLEMRPGFFQVRLVLVGID
jgi:hypothetical protein